MTARHRWASSSALAALLVLAADIAAQPADKPAEAVARIGRPRLRLQGAVINVAFAPRGTTFLATGDPVVGSGSMERLIVLFDAATGKEVRQYRGHAAGVEAVAFSADGKRFVTGSIDKTVRVWDAASGDEIKQFSGHTLNILAVAFCPDGKRVASEGQDATLRIWDIDTGKEVKRLPGHRSKGTSNLRFSPDGKWLASVGADFAVRLWNPDTGAEVRKLAGPAMDSESLDFSPDGKRLVAVSEDGQLWVWDTDTGKELLRIRAHEQQAVCVRWSPDGQTIASGGFEGSIKFWDAEKGQLLRAARAHPRSVSELSFSADSQWLATAGHEGTARIWDVATAAELPQSGGGVSRLALSADGTRLATMGSEPRVRFWAPATGEELKPAIAMDRPAAALAFSPDGKTLATMETADDVRHWAVETGKFKVAQGQPSALPVTRLSTSPHSRLLAVTSRSTLRFWSADGKAVPPGTEVFRGEAQRLLPAQAMLVLPGDTHIAFAGRDNRVRLWDATSGVETTPNPAAAADTTLVSALACTADGRTIADGSVRAVRLWEAATGTGRRFALGVPNIPRALAFSPNRRLLAIGGDGGFLIIWDLWSRAELARLTPHAGPITDLAFTPDGRFLISAGGELVVTTFTGAETVIAGDGTALVWDVAALVRKLPDIPPATKETLESLWSEITDPDQTKVEVALWRLAAAPELAVPLAEEKLPKLGTVGGGDVAKLIAMLDDDDFDVREKATAELIRRGPAVAPAVKRALAETKSPEVRRRAQTVLAKLGAGGAAAASPEDALLVRGIELLQRIDTADARRVLEAWAQNPADSALGREARIAVRRFPPKP